MNTKEEESIIYSECVFVALGIQHAMRMCRIVICDLSGYTIFLSHKQHDFRDRQNPCFDIQQRFLFLQEMGEILLKILIGLHVKYRLLFLGG
jgi:hypothetical protein